MTKENLQLADVYSFSLFCKTFSFSVCDVISASEEVDPAVSGGELKRDPQLGRTSATQQPGGEHLLTAFFTCRSSTFSLQRSEAIIKKLSPLCHLTEMFLASTGEE